LSFIAKKAEFMSYFFIANIKIHDPEAYQKYIAGASEIFQKYNGTYLAVDNQPEVLEGEWNYTRCVIIGFESKHDFEAWYHSKEYQEILKHRLAGAQCDTILVEGKV
jgi:uncharacterized protein (DUF1330 family)